MKKGRYLLEGCAVDPLLNDQAFLKLVVSLRKESLIDIFVTDLTFDDIDHIQNEERRLALRAVIAQIDPENAFYPAVLVGEGHKRNRPTLTGHVVTLSEETMQLLHRLKHDGRADARQVVAAKMIDATLVTNDQGLIRRALSEGINAITTEQWRAELEELI